MNIEEQLKQTNELLKKMLSRTYSDTEEEKKAKQEEIEELDETIERYQTELDELTSKIADENNYKRTKSDFELKERPIVEELLSDSIADEREEVFKYNQSLRKNHEQQSKMLDIYNEEVSKLKDEIKDIEARLNKDAIAKKRGIAKKLHLSEEEVLTLQKEIDYKKELIEEGQQVIAICLDEIKRYDRLISENNDRLNFITKKEQRLTALLCSKHENETDVDRYRMRLDRDKICKIISGLASLKKRREYLLYDPTKEIKEQLEQNEAMLNDLKDSKDDTKFVFKPSNGSEDNKYSEEAIEEKSNNESQFEQGSEENTIVKQDDELMPNPDIFDELMNKKKNIMEPEQKQETEIANDEQSKGKEITVSDFLPMEVKEIYDAPEELKQQKLSEKFKNVWRKWRDKAIAVAVAAAVTITSGKLFSNMSHENKFEKVDNQIEQPKDQTKDDIEDNFTLENPSSDLDNTNTEISQEPIPEPEKDDLITKPIKKEEENIQSPVVEQPKYEEIVSPTPTVPEVTPDIPEVEEEKPIEEIVQKPVLEGIVNTDEIETTVLQAEGEYVDIPLKNGDIVFVKYGDNGENVPDDIVIKYDGTDMYIYSPIVNSKRL